MFGLCLVVFVSTLTGFAMCYNTPYEDACAKEGCENGSPCRTVMLNINGSYVTKGECVCHGKWFGSRCDSQIFVKVQNVASDSITVKILIGANLTHSIAFSKKTDRAFSLIYWTNDSSSGCSLLRNLQDITYTVLGLKHLTQYTLCAKSDTTEWCYPSYHSDGISSNCIRFTTKIVEDRRTSDLVLPLSIIVAILMVLILVVICCVRKRLIVIFGRRCGSDTVKLHSGRRRRRKDSKEDLPFLVGSETPPPERSLALRPSSPGKPRNKLGNSHRGYTAYSARNNKHVALKTIIEYSPERSGAFTECSVEIHR